MGRAKEANMFVSTETVRRRILIAVAAGFAGLLAFAPAKPASAQQPIELKLAHFLPTANGMHKDFAEPWSRQLEACSHNKVKITIYPAGTQLANIGRLYDEVSSGVIDIALGLAGIPAGRLERLRLMELPFMVKTADAASRTLWDLHDLIKPDFPNLKVLALFATNAGQIHMVGKRVRNIEDLKGMRIRFPSEAIKQMLSYLGAVPVGLPPGAVYENMEKGVIDGAVFTWDAMDSFKLAEVTKYHLDAKAYVATFWFAMNQRKFDGLPKDVQDCVNKLSGATLAAKFGKWWNEWDAPGLKLVKDKGHPIDELSPAQRTKWREILKPMIDKYIAHVESKGVKNARAIYDKMRERVATYEK
jgi:TRAP-type C4-dicarboxylate transport system substrate-binding protein